MSVTRAPMKHTIGIGTNIGWIGCWATCAVGRRVASASLGNAIPPQLGIQPFHCPNRLAIGLVPNPSIELLAISSIAALARSNASNLAQFLKVRAGTGSECQNQTT